MEVLGGSWARARGATYLCVSGVAIVSAVWAWGGPAGVWASISWIASRILGSKARREARYGVRTSVLREILRRMGREKLKLLTTKEFAERIKLETADCKSSWVQYTAEDAYVGGYMVGVAQVYVSHSWSSNVVDLFDAIVDTMERFQEELGEDPIIWLDVLSVSQHRPQGRNRLEWVNLLINAIGSQRRVVLVLNSAHAPTVLKRLWCVLEVLACILSKGRVSLAFPPAERARFLTEVKANPSYVRTLFAQLRTTECTCSHTKDRDAIVVAIKRRGFDSLKLDRTVRDTLQSASYHLLRAEADAQSDGVERGKALAALGLVLMETGRGQEAVTELEGAVRLLREAGGAEGPEAVAVMASLSVAYSRVGRHADVRRVCEQGLEARTRLYGEHHRETLRARSNLAQAYSNLKQWDQALAQHLKGLEARRVVLGEEHEETLASMQQLAVAQYNLGDYGGAEATLKECLEKRRRVLGPKHADTAMTLSWQGMVHFKQERYPEAELLFKEELRIRQKISGGAHPLTVTAERNLAAAARKLQRR